MFSEEILVTIIGALMVMWLATLSYIWVSHVKSDMREHKAQKKDTKEILERVSRHDEYQRDFNLKLENRLTKMETGLNFLVKRYGRSD